MMKKHDSTAFGDLHMFDLITPEGVQAYLDQTPFAASSVVALTGGFANFTYRITLRDPHITPGNNVPIKTLVMKHAAPYVAAYKNIPFPVERQGFECAAFELVPTFVRLSSIVRLPTLYYQDRANGVMLMSDGGPESRSLKATLQSGPLPDVVADDIGTELGRFIAQLHVATRNPTPGTPAYNAKSAVATNRAARSIVASMYFGSIISTLTEKPFTPPIVISTETLFKLEAFAQKSQERVNTSTDVLNMGDFWTGNIVFALDPAPRVMVVDWEAARPGFSGMDLGQFLAELHLLRVFHPNSRACVDIIIAAFTRAYRATVLENGNCVDAEQRLAEAAYDAGARVGTHLIVLTPQVPWGSPELTRETVQEGVEYIIHSVDRDDAWLRKSVIRGFWGWS